MTTLNTIIEEGKREAREKFEDSPVSLRIDALERYAHVHGWSQFEGRTIQDEIDSVLTTAIQRAVEYERARIRESFDNWFKNGTEDVEDWADRNLPTNQGQISR